MSDTLEPVYTLQEAAEMLRLPYRAVRDAVFQERWPCINVSPRKRLMSASDVAAAVALMRQPAKPPTRESSARSARRSVLDHLNRA